MIDKPQNFIKLDMDEEAAKFSTNESNRDAESGLFYVIAVIERKKLAALEKVLWKAMRGNVFMNSKELPVDCSNCSDDHLKNVFIVFCPGRESSLRVKKICQALNCYIFDIPSEPSDRDKLFGSTMARIDDVNLVLFNTRQAIYAELDLIGKVYLQWLYFVRREKAIYEVLNMLNYDIGRKGLIAEAWCPSSSVSFVSDCISNLKNESNLQASSILTVVETELSPPTFFVTTLSSAAYQEMTDAYGVASYKEANPALLMSFTFPFLFALMFGDIGHAFIIILFSAYLIVKERQLAFLLKDEIGSMFYGGRYVILWMGIFSLFIGLIYNDIFSRSLSIFPSSFTYDKNEVYSKIQGYTHIFGIDPVWNHSSNGLMFINSYKMKQAIVLGVIHMLFGIIIGISNSIYKHDNVTLYGQQIPQLLFMISLFGYLCFLIIFKWVFAINVSLLNTFINLALQLGAVEGDELFTGQVLNFHLVISSTLSDPHFRDVHSVDVIR